MKLSDFFQNPYKAVLGENAAEMAARQGMIASQSQMANRFSAMQQWPDMASAVEGLRKENQELRRRLSSPEWQAFENEMKELDDNAQIANMRATKAAQTNTAIINAVKSVLQGLTMFSPEALAQVIATQPDIGSLLRTAVFLAPAYEQDTNVTKG